MGQRQFGITLVFTVMGVLLATCGESEPNFPPPPPESESYACSASWEGRTFRYDCDAVADYAASCWAYLMEGEFGAPEDCVAAAEGDTSGLQACLEYQGTEGFGALLRHGDPCSDFLRYLDSIR